MIFKQCAYVLLKKLYLVCKSAKSFINIVNRNKVEEKNLQSLHIHTQGYCSFCDTGILPLIASHFFRETLENRLLWLACLRIAAHHFIFPKKYSCTKKLQQKKMSQSFFKGFFLQDRKIIKIECKVGNFRFIILKFSRDFLG